MQSLMKPQVATDLDSIACVPKKDAILGKVAADRVLLERWRNGDRTAGEALYRNWVGALSRFFRNKVSDREEVPDLVSQTFVALTEVKDRFRGESSIRRLVFSLARKMLSAHLRKRYKRAREAKDFDTLCVAQVSAHGPSSLVARERGLRAFVDGLRQLSLGDQTLLELRYFEGLTGPELADVYDVPEGTIRGRIARAVGRLGRVVEEKLGHEPGRSDAPAVDEVALGSWARALRVQLGRDPDG